MRGETDFRVKGENIGQPEVIFRKMIFSVTAKHEEKGENDFLKLFSPKTNAPLKENNIGSHHFVTSDCKPFVRVASIPDPYGAS